MRCALLAFPMSIQPFLLHTGRSQLLYETVVKSLERWLVSTWHRGTLSPLSRGRTVYRGLMIEEGDTT